DDVDAEPPFEHVIEPSAVSGNVRRSRASQDRRWQGRRTKAHTWCGEDEDTASGDPGRPGTLRFPVPAPVRRSSRAPPNHVRSTHAYGVPGSRTVARSPP